MTPPAAPTVGGRIVQARAYSRLTQHDIEREVGVSRRTLSSWEHDKTSPTVDHLLAFAEATGFPATWFVEGLESERSSLIARYVGADQSSWEQLCLAS
jgi:transcriptional regulator with XRE-family HTH domain